MSAVSTVKDYQSTWCKNTATPLAGPQALHPTITHNSYALTVPSHIPSSHAHTYTHTYHTHIHIHTHTTQTYHTYTHIHTHTHTHTHSLPSPGSPTEIDSHI